MLSNEEVLRQFDGLKLRTIVRNTNTYANIQLHLLHPEYLKDGIDRSIELEWLARPLAGTKVPQEWRIKVYEHERKAMEQLDVPHFNTFQKWSKRAVYTDEDYRNLNRQRDSTIIREKLKLLSKREFLRNIKIIESAIRSRFRI